MTSPVRPVTGKLGVLTVGLGAVATTFMAGVESIRRGKSLPIGSLTQMATIRLGKRTDNRSPLIKDFVPLAGLDDLVFGAWDPIPDDAYQAAIKAGVLTPADLAGVSDFLQTIAPMPAAFDQHYVTRINGTHVKKGKTKRDLAEQIRQDIRDFKSRHHLDRLVMVWCASTEIYIKAGAAHATLEQFEKAMERNDESIAPSMLYAYAALMEGVAFANGAPNLTVDMPCLIRLANERGVPISGKDFKTGQTWMKTVIAPGLKARMLGLAGWYSTNILGNRDGEVLDDPASFKTKEESKLSVLHTILQPDIYPALYKDFSHVVRINYYPPRGDNKEGWDNIDFAKRACLKGIQEWLSFYYKSPMAAPGLQPEHDLFIQQTKLKNTLRHLMGEEQITHLGLEYYA
jgi:myo-inositol-1-phosphate synthase